MLICPQELITVLGTASIMKTILYPGFLSKKSKGTPSYSSIFPESVVCESLGNGCYLNNCNTCKVVTVQEKVPSGYKIIDTMDT